MTKVGTGSTDCAGVGNKPNVLSKRDPYFTLQTDFSQQ